MPDAADNLVAEALALFRAERWPAAEQRARAALALRPDQADALNLLGIVAWRTGRLEEAARFISQTLRLAPQYAEGHENLGTILLSLGRAREAILHFRQATVLQLKRPHAQYHLATALRETGDLTAAMAVWREVLAVDPGHADAQNDLGAALRDTGQLAQAIDCFRHAVAARLDFIMAHVNLGGALLEYGDPAAARDAFRRAREIAPERADVRLGYCLSFLSVIYANDAEIAASRAAYTRELTAVQTQYERAPAAELAAAASVAGSHIPFYLPYQGQDDRVLQEMFGGLLRRLMAAGFPDHAQRPPMPPLPPGGKIRIGVVSAFFRNHSVWKLFGGWVRHMDRSRFAFHAYSTSRAQQVTATARDCFDSFTDPPSSFADLVARIHADKLHVLLFPEIGMDPVTERVAALRLAPVQAMAYGHPETTGLPTVDYFLSSELMEPPEAETLYSEKLIRLPHTGLHYEPLDVVAEPFDLARHGVRADAVKYLCCQSLHKYLPRHDALLPRIAQAVPAAQFIFIRHHLGQEIFQHRLAAAFAAAGLDAAAHVVFVPPMTLPAYTGLNAACDIYLDSLEWSGGNTTLEAIAVGLPIVTVAGKFLRGRVSAGILAMMDATETLARDEDDYVVLATRLGQDPAWRQAIAAKVKANAPRLYRDMTPVKALENLIASWCAG
jgi:predicted O-linked N-acetylglucosamine transferase (SPINDLY family)